jgi:aryl-alcohol dehydrogenase-like predicted oxidoreductase
VESRRLGQQGPLVSLIGFGAFKIGRNQHIKYAADYPLPDEAAAARLLNEVLDAGVTYIDTAPAYGLSEERIGAALDHRRGEFTLSTKVGEMYGPTGSSYDFSSAAIERSIHGSLRRLRVDVLDLIFLHSPGDDLKILDETDAVATLMRLRDAGTIRWIGLSGKTVDGAAAALAWADAIMVEYHSDDLSHADVITQAAARGVGVVVKKPLAAGRLPPASALNFVAANPAVASMIVGTLKIEHLRANIACLGT